MTRPDRSDPLRHLIERAKLATNELRDAAREGRVIHFRQRDELVMAIHNALNQLEALLVRSGGGGARADQLDLEPIREAVQAARRKPPIRWGRGDIQPLVERDIPALIAEVERLRAALLVADDDLNFRLFEANHKLDTALAALGGGVDRPKEYPDRASAESACSVSASPDVDGPTAVVGLDPSVPNGEDSGRSEPALLTYMTTTDPVLRDAAYLDTYAERVRNGSEVSWEIPTTRARTLEAIAKHMRERQVAVPPVVPPQPEPNCEPKTTDVSGCDLAAGRDRSVTHDRGRNDVPDPHGLRAEVAPVVPPVAGLIARLEDYYDFQCAGGPLKNCVEWQELKTLLVGAGGGGARADQLAEEEAMGEIKVGGYGAGGCSCAITAVIYCPVHGSDRRVEQLETAIRAHRDARGDDRCWRDDEALYELLPEGYTAPPRDSAVELENCRRFIASRQHPHTEYISPEREIEQLKAQRAALGGGADRQKENHEQETPLPEVSRPIGAGHRAVQTNDSLVREVPEDREALQDPALAVPPVVPCSGNCEENGHASETDTESKPAAVSVGAADQERP